MELVRAEYDRVTATALAHAREEYLLELQEHLQAQSKVGRGRCLCVLCSIWFVVKGE